jgi:hypothetical protein
LPNCGIYNELLLLFFKKITDAEVINVQKSEESIKLGYKYSPIDIDKTFKNKLGILIVALNNDCNYLIDMETNTVRRYYYLLENEILERLGYTFKIVKLTKNNHLSPKRIYEFARIINPELTFLKFIRNYLKLKLGILIIKLQNNKN